MPHCTKCGNLVQNSDVFCGACGKRQLQPLALSRSGTIPVDLRQWRQDIDEKNRRPAVHFVTDQALLAEIAKSNDELDVCGEAFHKVRNQALHADIAMKSFHWQIRKRAVGELTAQALLAQVVRTEEESHVRAAAIERLTDQALLAEIARTHRDRAVRKEAEKALARSARPPALPTGYRCRSCGYLQRENEWEEAMTAAAKAQGATGFYNISAKPACVRCGSLDLEDRQNPSASSAAPPSVPQHEQLVELCRAYEQAVARYRSGSMEADKTIQEIRIQIAGVGQKLGDLGGIALMRQVGESLPSPQWRNWVDASWSGIHGWMY